MERNQERSNTLYTRRAFLATTTLAAAGAACGRIASKSSLIQVFHAPKRYARRAGDFTANVCGIFNAKVKSARYRLNSGLWLKLGQAPPRVPSPLFTIEMSANELHSGTNHLEIEATANGYKSEAKLVQFEYDPTPIIPSLNVDWSNGDLDVQDGHWESILVDGKRYVRPIPGSENYDRIIVVSGAFSTGRRIETALVFRHSIDDERPFGFGVFPLWGGRPDDPGVSPRRGWNFSLAWYYSRQDGVGMDFSYKYGDAAPPWVRTYRDFIPQPGRRYFISIEAWPELDAAERHLGYRQRMKWRAEGEPSPDEWMELADTEGTTPLPPREYGIALVAHRSQVEFGPVLIKPIDTLGLRS